MRCRRRGSATDAAPIAAADERLGSRHWWRLCCRLFVAVATARTGAVAVIGTRQQAILFGLDDFVFRFGRFCARFGAFDFHFETFVQCGLVIDGHFVASLAGTLATGVRRHRATCGGVDRR